MALQSSLSRKKAASQKPRYQNVLLVDFCVKLEDIHRQEAWHQTRLQKPFTIKHLSSDTTRLAWAGKKSSSREISFSISYMIRWSPFLKEGTPSKERGPAVEIQISAPLWGNANKAAVFGSQERSRVEIKQSFE